MTLPERGEGPAVETVRLEPVDALSITLLVDNEIDVLLPDDGPARRPPLGGSDAPRVAAATLAAGETFDFLRAEHGFSALVSVEQAGRERRILFDTGVTPDGLIDNMRRLDIDPRTVETVVLSHGHFDHTTGMDGFIRAVGRANLPVLIHPEFWTQRRIRLPGRDPLDLPSTSRRALEDAGFEIVEHSQPSFLLDGALLVTGEVDRTTAFETGFPIHEAYRGGAWQPDPLILDDQALVLNVRGRGLVVMTGCGHAGIINVLRHARRLCGEDTIHAVVGGFHLTGPAFEPVIPPTLDALAGFSPDVLVPCHCTGWRAKHALAARFPQAFVQTSVGTRIELNGAQTDAG